MRSNIYQNTVYQNVAQPAPRRRSAVAGAPSKIRRGGRPVEDPPRRAPRNAISLIEVLISMGVLAVGLLSVAALFPVGGYYMRKGEISDRGAAIAQAAFSDIVARGVLKPDNWLAMGHRTNNTDSTLVFEKPFRLRLQSVLHNRINAVAVSDFPPPPPTLPEVQTMNNEFGSVFVIDPLGVAAYSEATSVPGPGASRFPYNGSAFSFGIPANSDQWRPWALPTGIQVNHPQWPVARLTVGENSTPMSLAAAHTIFASRDDLVFNPPSKNGPSTQPWDVVNNLPLSRQSAGDYSMLVTVAPATQEARDSLADAPTAHTYSVSVVVFYKRVLGDVSTEFGNALAYSNAEHLVRARVMTKGLSGGELLISNNSGSVAQKPFDELKAGQWVSLFGPHPQSTVERQIFFFQWYRVVAVEGEDEKINAFGNPEITSTIDRRVVSLRGPAWPWEVEPSDSSPNILANDLRVGIFPGAVAVHSKTMRLEGNSLWSVD